MKLNLSNPKLLLLLLTLAAFMGGCKTTGSDPKGPKSGGKTTDGGAVVICDSIQKSLGAITGSTVGFLDFYRAYELAPDSSKERNDKYSTMHLFGNAGYKTPKDVALGLLARIQ